MVGDDGDGGLHGDTSIATCRCRGACSGKMAQRRRWASEVLDILSGVAPVPRAAIRLAYFDRLSSAEIAERLATPVEQVQVAMSTAMRLLGTSLVQRR